MSDYILIHHGVKGQKWGVRRYQNPDGSLTEAGKKRYDKISDKALNKVNKKLPKINKKWDREDLNNPDTLKRYDKEVMDYHNKVLSRYERRENIKDRVKTGALVGGAALATIGGIYLYKSGNLDRLVDSGKSAFQNFNSGISTPRTKINRASVDIVDVPRTHVNQIYVNKALINKTSLNSQGSLMDAVRSKKPEVSRLAKQVQDKFSKDIDTVVKDFRSGRIDQREYARQLKEIQDKKEIIGKQLSRM